MLKDSERNVGGAGGQDDRPTVTPRLILFFSRPPTSDLRPPTSDFRPPEREALRNLWPRLSHFGFPFFTFRLWRVTRDLWVVRSTAGFQSHRGYARFFS